MVDGAGRPEPALRPVERYRLYEQLVRRLLDYIEEAGLAPGQQLPGERDLASRLGVSRTSVRQALVALEVQGVVGRRHGGGTFLVSRDRDDTVAALRKRRQRLPDVLEAREALEVKIAELAAARRTDADLAAITRALDRMADDIDAGGYGVEGDAQFHAAVAKAAHNALLVDIMSHLSELITETRIESLTQPGRPNRSLAGHRRIADAITAGDGRKAASAMRAHVRLVGRVMLLK
ncbi:MAG TPA: FCD domain-containing protein [Pseudonocardiaceae bacterium]|jgi:GntR family transcriptional repressor for pyruvate dehydrogenase complex|nr:FCD domain-containing protein [Pseudonocardiaceae bacterium]